MKPAELSLLDSPDDSDFRLAQRLHNRVHDVLTRSGVMVFAADLSAETYVGDIIVVERPPMSHIAAGTLFQFEQLPFLVTAAHVVNEFRRTGKQIRIALGNPSRPQELPASDDLIAADEQNDVAVIRLTAQTVNQLQNPLFLTLSDIALDADVEGWWCAVLGYLAEGTRPSRDYSGLLVENFHCYMRASSRATTNSTYSPDRHLLMQAERGGRDMWDGRPIRFPSTLKGLSGASLWRVFRPEHSEQEWTESVMRVVAVENLTYGEPPDLIRCTKWTHVLPLLERLRP